MATTVTRDNVAKMLKGVEAMTKRHVLIGIPAEKADRGGGSPINNATIGYIQETGSPASNIPPRPHLVPGVEKITPQAIDIFQKAGSAALSGKADKVEEGFNAVGLMAVSSVRATITAVIPPPLSAATLYRRKHRKVKKAGDPAPHEGETPLIDTGAYLQAQSYVIRDKED